jgi:hypothetical protein
MYTYGRLCWRWLCGFGSHPTVVEIKVRVRVRTKAANERITVTNNKGLVSSSSSSTISLAINTLRLFHSISRHSLLRNPRCATSQRHDWNHLVPKAGLNATSTVVDRTLSSEVALFASYALAFRYGQTVPRPACDGGVDMLFSPPICASAHALRVSV